MSDRLERVPFLVSGFETDGNNINLSKTKKKDINISYNFSIESYLIK